MISACAIFDLDGTIIDTSSERVFLQYLIEHGEIPVGNLLRWLQYFLNTHDLRASKANKTYLRGLNEPHLRELAQVCFKERLVNHISPRVFELMDSHRVAGRATVILSGSLEILVQNFHANLETDLRVGYQLEVAAERVTGNRVGINPYGQGKAELVRELAETHNFELSQSYAYGNHYSDAHKLRLFGHPVAVNPDRKLQQIAMANGWEIEQFHGE
jgi:HAD superfamily hydrolase (TIGR01490 family)